MGVSRSSLLIFYENFRKFPSPDLDSAGKLPEVTLQLPVDLPMRISGMTMSQSLSGGGGNRREFSGALGPFGLFSDKESLSGLLGVPDWSPMGMAGSSRLFFDQNCREFAIRINFICSLTETARS